MFKRGEIYLANLNPKKGNEVGKLRPILIYQTDFLNTVEHPTTIILPLSTYLIDNVYPLRFRILKRDKLERDSDILIDQIRTIFQEAQMIHGDLGEFNIVLDEKGNLLIIDWLQWVPNDHPNAKSLLRRDIDNVCNYFRKKYKLDTNVDEIIDTFYNK